MRRQKLAVTLQARNNQGANGTASVTITAKAEEPTPEVKMETGEVMVSSDWVRVTLTTPFANPVVIAGPPSFSNSEPCVIRLRNVNSTGFDIRLTEWNYQDGVHPQEAVSYLVMEKGRHTLPNGSSVEAGTYAGTTSFKTVPFSKPFTKAPVVLTTIASYNETDTISGRIKSVTTTSFAYYFREQEKNKNIHVNETVNFIAWEPGTGTIGSVQFEAAATANAVTSAWYSATFQTAAPQAPLLLADMQTTNNTDTSVLRVQKLTIQCNQPPHDRQATSKAHRSARETDHENNDHAHQGSPYRSPDQPPCRRLFSFGLWSRLYWQPQRSEHH